ncbi:PAS domain-containing protein [Allomuricauda sp. F6463D]|uniref:PAS domain-containing protein n=1 Tax=Allomuricauda sp. F6463D TaxID=2926409 RepID=UPI001FF2F82F|nr:PAS domain-containing protein [Muricauda sp. F6463D]MCK0162050.1 PAS domain-containing protein [Muricauda sp. F6463D]
MDSQDKTYLSPLISFDFYLENYHKLLGELKKENDLRQLKTIIKEDVGLELQEQIKTNTYHALVLTDVYRQIVWVNDGFHMMTGYSKSYALGKKPNFLQGVKTSEKTKQEIHKQLNNKHRFTGTILNYRKNGEMYQCHIKIVPIYGTKKELTYFIAFEQELSVVQF